jgi:lipopolysaccharide heptosyltransferase II
MILNKSAGTAYKRFLIINPFGIGDVLFTFPVIKAIKDAYPQSFIGFWCNNRVEPIIKLNPLVNESYPLSRGDLKKIYKDSFIKGLFSAIKLVWSIRRGRFQVCLDFSLDHRYGLFSLVTGIRRRIGFNFKGRGRFLTDKIDINGYSEKHAIEYYLSLLDFLGIVPKNKVFQLSAPAQIQDKAKDILAMKGIEQGDLLVGIAPGAGGSWGKDADYKHWPAVRFAQLADKLVDKYKAKVLILGDESERPLADVLLNAMRNKPIDLAGKLNLKDLPGVIGHCSLFISNDGGPMHLAVALGVKSVSIFGPVNENVYGPYVLERKHLVVKAPLECRPCYGNFRLPVCDKDRECLKSISVEEVFAAVERLLKENK